MRRLAAVLGLLLSSSLAGSCGGSGSPKTVTITLFGNAALDGWVTQSGQVFTNQTVLQVGDVDGLFLPPPGLPDGARGFWSFDLAPLPAGATIVTASLTAFQSNANAAVYANHGVVTLDHLDYGASLGVTDYGAPAIASAFGTLSPDATLGGKTADVTARVQLDRAAARPRSQFRVRFSVFDSDADFLPDTVYFTAAASTTEPPPTLTVTYLP